MTFKYRYRKQIIACCTVLLILILGGIGGFCYYQYNYKGKSKVDKKEVLLSTKKSTSKSVNELEKDTTKKVKKEENPLIKVDIKGEVNAPGLYTLEEGSRVSDVIELAGGVTAFGDTTVINLSKKVTDEMVIIIYSKEEVADFKKTEEVYKQVIDNCKKGYEGVKNDACISTEEESAEEGSTLITGPISINKATKEELLTLPGVGEAKADNILKYREEHGAFTSIEELKEVNGIGDSIFDKIKEDITL